MARAHENPELRVRLLRELAGRLYWGGLGYALFAALFTVELAPSLRPVAWGLSFALLVLGAVRTCCAGTASSALSGQSVNHAGARMVAVAKIHSVIFCLFVTYAAWNVNGSTMSESLLLVGVGGLSSVSASLFAPFPRLARFHVGAMVLPVYTWSLFALPRYGWLLASFIAIHAVAVTLLIRMNGLHVRRMFEAQILLEGQSVDLRRARDLAEETSSARLRFLAHMSHEIRTPLNGILGLTEVLGLTALTREQRDLLTTLSRSGRHLMSIVNDSLDLAKVSSGKLTLEKVPFDLPLLIQDVTAPALALAQAKGLRFAVDTTPGLPSRAIGDPVRIRQILSNLLSNAVKFTEQGEVRLVLSPLPGDWIRCAVSDTGIGMSADQKAMLFQEFRQVDSSTTRKFGGTGLGLVISRRLADLMGGRLSAESWLEAGSRFTLEIPLPACAPTERPPAEPGPQLHLPPGLRVLVAEDNAINQLVMRRLLAAAGVTAEVVDNGRAALESHQAVPYDIILMDCQMPELDGYAATTRIRSLPDHRAGVPIVGVTANAFAEDRERCERVGMDSYVAKPVNRDTLLQAMRQAMAKRAAAASSTPPAERLPLPSCGVEVCR